VYALAERWPALKALARIGIAELPTPVEEMRHSSEHLETRVWVKRDDLTAAEFGGNKVRKLEFLLGDLRARGADTVITSGAAGSHHVFASALYGGRLGFDVHAVLLPQPHSEHAEAQLRATLSRGAKLVPALTYPQVVRETGELMLKLSLWGLKPRIIAPGGSSLQGVLGYVNAGVELAQQIDRGLCPDPDAIYVACGTAATTAGIALGLCAAGVRTKIVAVRVADKIFGNAKRIARLIGKAQRTLREVTPHFPEVAAAAIASVTIDEVEIGKGYGYATPSALQAIALAHEDGIKLDATYTGKAFACLVRDAAAGMRGKQLLFWNTFSSRPLAPFLLDAPIIPDELTKLLMRAGDTKLAE
jgi:1-aminocyclopropane-1-carboxylate deaminase/D-cysteine desulfhydrase-like pyridoxal-dependent ACC family enzyme